uniref:Coiled-coil domain containing 189 n=1 Tax=Xenopus tropicalis TaxID=8364 RepID=A0A803JQL3_XENTR
NNVRGDRIPETRNRGATVGKSVRPISSLLTAHSIRLSTHDIYLHTQKYNVIYNNIYNYDCFLCLSFQIKRRKPQICLWRDLSLHDVETLEKAKGADDIHRALSHILHLDCDASDPRASVILDLYYYTVRFCQDCGFNREQTSCLFSIVKETHAACTDTPLSNIDACYQYFKELLLCHSVHRPPFSLELFTQQQILQISSYMMNTYFRHFKLYKYVFTPQVHLDLSILYEGMAEAEVASDREQESPRPDISSEATALEEKGECSVAVNAPLRHYIEQSLGKEVERLRSEVDRKLRLNEELMQERLGEPQDARAKSPGQRNKRVSIKGK